MASAIAGDQSEVRGATLDSGSRPNARQLEEAGELVPDPAVWPIEWAREPSRFEGYDVVVAGTSASMIYVITRAVSAIGSQRRPIVVTGYWGVVYEKYLEGLLWRIGADVICLNSAADYERFRKVCIELGVDPSALVRSGIPFSRRREPILGRRVRTVTFAVQPDIPRSREDRQYVLHKLVEHASIHPDRRIIVKLRGRPDEATTHPEVYHYETLFEGSQLTLPPNLDFVYGRMSDVLKQTDLCLTVSSTAALEALAHGVRAGIITDFGVGESLGNHAFHDSGCLVSFAELNAGKVPEPNQRWLDHNGLGREDTVANVRLRVAELLAKRKAAGLDAPEPWITSGRADALLMKLEERFDPRAPKSPPFTPRLVRLLVAKVMKLVRPWHRRVRRWAEADHHI